MNWFLTIDYITQGLYNKETSQNQLEKSISIMKSLELSFQGSPEKFCSAACCDLVYTESKLYDNVLFKDLLSFKDIWTYKSQVMTLEALNSHLEDFLKVKLQQKDCIISTQKIEIQFLREQNHKLTQNNLQRTKRLLKSHQASIRKLLTQKQEQITIIQGQKQLLQARISELEKQLQYTAQMVNGVEIERSQMQGREKMNEQLTLKLETQQKRLENQVQRLQKENRAITSQLSEQKLELELKYKRQLCEMKQQHKQQIQDVENFYKLQMENLHRQILDQSLSGKETLNRTIDRYESALGEIKSRNRMLDEQVETLTNSLAGEKQRNQSLLKDISKQDNLLDTYQNYLKTADTNMLTLNQQLTQTQLQLQQSAHTIQKQLIQKQSLLNTIKICEQEAIKWRQAYYLTKSRFSFND